MEFYPCWDAGYAFFCPNRLGEYCLIYSVKNQLPTYWKLFNVIHAIGFCEHVGYIFLCYRQCILKEWTLYLFHRVWTEILYNNYKFYINNSEFYIIIINWTTGIFAETIVDWLSQWIFVGFLSDSSSVIVLNRALRYRTSWLANEIAINSTSHVDKATEFWFLDFVEIIGLFSVCGPMLVTVPSVMWLLVTLLIVAVILVTTTFFPSICFVKSFRAHAVFERFTKWGWHDSVGSSSDGQVIWVARLSSNSKNRENPLLTNNKNAFYWNTFVRQ